MDKDKQRTNLDLLASTLPLSAISAVIMYLAEHYGYGVEALPLIEYSGHSVIAETAAYLTLTISQCILEGEAFEPKEKAVLSVIASVLIEVLGIQSLPDSKDVFFIIVTALMLYKIDIQLIQLTKPVVSYIENKYRENQ